jgi:hypothetical protein
MSVLRNLCSAELDLALIDGRHGFPTPFMDCYFVGTAALKLGGIRIVDGVQRSDLNWMKVMPSDLEPKRALSFPRIDTNSAGAVPHIARRAAEQAVRTKAASAGGGSDQSRPR